MADRLVLVSDLVDLDKDKVQVVVAKAGDVLPEKYKASKDDYVDAGILVPESYYGLMTNDTLRRAAIQGLSLDEVRQLSKQDMENVRAVSEATKTE